ncbi:hypothetical protein ABFS83_08G141500 [Erythranthe nasuta]
MVVEKFRNRAWELEYYDKAYELRRALVEITELYREADSQFWVARLRSERDSASIFIGEFLYTWDFGMRYFLDQENTEKIRLLRKYAASNSSNNNVDDDDVVGRFLDDIQPQLINRFRSLLTVEACHVAEVVSRLTDVPLTQIVRSRDYKENSINMIKSRVVDQDGVIDEIFKTLAFEVTSSTTHRRRPRGSFLLLGPSGVGKTEIAKAVARHWYCDTSRFVEIDMAEYAAVKSINQSAECRDFWNRVNEVVAKRPYSVILLDNIDKASSVVVRALVEVLNNGAKNNSVDLSKSILFLTSTNVASNNLNGYVSDLLDSLDKVVVVERFSNRQAVARLLIREIVRDVYGERIVVHASNAAIDALFLKAPTLDIEGGKAIRNALLEHVIPRLSTAQGLNDVYVDTVVGTTTTTNELSFRFQTQVENVGDVYFKFVDGAFDNFIADLRTKVEAVDTLFKLRQTTSSSSSSSIIIDACDEILKCSLSSYDMLLKYERRDEYSRVPTVEEKERFEHLCSRMKKKDDLAKIMALNTSLKKKKKDDNLSVKHCLLKGLSRFEKLELISELKESFGESLLLHVRVDQDECRGDQVKKLLLERVKENNNNNSEDNNSGMVLVFDGLVFADDVLYNTLLDIFDNGTALDPVDHTHVDFRKCLIYLFSKYY